MFFIRAAGLGAAAIAAIWFVVSLGVNAAVERVVIRDALEEAEHWCSFMADRIPDLGGLIRTGVPTEEQMTAIEDMRTVGKIFKFKLFSSNGILAFTASDEGYEVPSHTAVTRTGIRRQNRQLHR